MPVTIPSGAHWLAEAPGVAHVQSPRCDVARRIEPSLIAFRYQGLDAALFEHMPSHQTNWASTDDEHGYFYFLHSSAFG